MPVCCPHWTGRAISTHRNEYTDLIPAAKQRPGHPLHAPALTSGLLFAGKKKPFRNQCEGKIVEQETIKGLDRVLFSPLLYSNHSLHLILSPMLSFDSVPLSELEFRKAHALSLSNLVGLEGAYLPCLSTKRPAEQSLCSVVGLLVPLPLSGSY